LTIPKGGLVFFTFAMLVSLVIQQTVAALKFFGGWAGIEAMPPPAIGSFIFRDKTEYYFLGLFLLSMNFVTYYLLYDSRIGRAWTAIGSGVGFAKSIGVDVVRYRLSAVILSSFFSAVSGSYLASYQMYIIPDSFGFYRSIMIQMFSLVGGLNNFLAGPIIGATIMTFVPEYLKVTAQIEPILTALLMILVIIFMPSGILGLISRCWRSSIVIRMRSKLNIGST
jgi:branched-chain amino acid transport system permease protein